MNNSFQFLTYGSHTGTFDTISYLDPGDGVVFGATYNATNVTITSAAGAAIPASASEALVPTMSAVTSQPNAVASTKHVTTFSILQINRYPKRRAADWII